MMNNGAPTQMRNGATPIPYRHMSTGSLNIPSGLSAAIGMNNGQPQPSGPMGTGARFDGPRSPPGKQNTSHVPCKFFRQGACQAGNSCPFSHDLANTTDNVCKYFAKGNCKFGPKCANAHILPDGRRVNYNKNGLVRDGLNIGSRVGPVPYAGQNSTLTTSIYNNTNVMARPSQSQLSAMYQNQEEEFLMNGRQSGMDPGIPIIDTQYASPPDLAYGSPRNNRFGGRSGLALSPIPPGGLSVLDVPLPASFDSNGVSWYAQNTSSSKYAASAPLRFGLESPPPSLGAAREIRNSEALKNLHSSAFGNETRDRFNSAAASPPTSNMEEYFGKRAMHSQRLTKPKTMSSSLPRHVVSIDKDWHSDFALDVDYLPNDLEELLTTDERARRGSRNAEGEPRPIHSGAATPGDSSSKFGSPSNGSPSKFATFFKSPPRDDEEKSSRGISAYGHVGSPLRSSSLNPSSMSSLRISSRPATGVSGDSSPFFSSPPNHGSMSILSQQLQRTRLQQAAAESGSRPSMGSSGMNGSTAARRTEMDRQVSNSSIGTGRFTTPIDEEGGEFVFSMEEEEDKDREKEREKEKEKEKRSSGGWTSLIAGRRGGAAAVGSRPIPRS